MTTIVPVILCGGSGTRLWPRSRASMPKPFLPLIGERTLFQEALERCADRSRFAAPLIVAGEKHVPIAEEQARRIAPDAGFIVEPIGRNTAPAIALAAHRLPPETVMLVCPSDHHVANEDAFRDAATKAADLAAQDWLVSFGIEAATPETGYGYIRKGEPLDGGLRVHSFVEKPDLETAKSFIADGGYAWNGGIFAFRAGKFLDELARHRPELAQGVAKAAAASRADGARSYPDEAIFTEIEGDSVDYAVMENTDRAAMVEVDMGWSDIGNWDALMLAREADEAGNVRRGPGQMLDCNRSMVDSDGPHVSLVGLDDVIVVVDGDDILVTSRHAVQQVNKLDKPQNQ